MTVALELWQLLAAVVVWTTSVVLALSWLNARFNGLLPIAKYEVRHEDLEKRVLVLEIWKAKQEDGKP